MGISLDDLDNFTPFWWANVLSEIAIGIAEVRPIETYISGFYGLDNFFIREANSNRHRMPILSIEDRAERLYMVTSSLSIPVQIQMLEDTLDIDNAIANAANNAIANAEMHYRGIEAWRSGDDQVLLEWIRIYVHDPYVHDTFFYGIFLRTIDPTRLQHGKQSLILDDTRQEGVFCSGSCPPSC